MTRMITYLVYMLTVVPFHSTQLTPSFVPKNGTFRRTAPDHLRKEKEKK